MTGDLIKNQIITRHHYKIGKDINNKDYKADCRISALVPVITKFHSTRGDPHTELYTNRFEDAKYYIEQGIAYIPAWWTQVNRLEYKRYLENNGIAYIEGRIK